MYPFLAKTTIIFCWQKEEDGHLPSIRSFDDDDDDDL